MPSGATMATGPLPAATWACTAATSPSWPIGWESSHCIQKVIKIFRKYARDDPTDFIRPFVEQVKSWKKANRKMNWGIADASFAAVGQPPALTPEDRADGFIGSILSYGFGDDGRGHADAVLSGRTAWAYARRKVTSRWCNRGINTGGNPPGTGRLKRLLPP